MDNYNILFLNADIEYSKGIIQSLVLPKNINFSFAHSGIQALCDITDSDISLLIVHEKLSHKMSGFEVCSLLIKKEISANIPIIFLKDKQKEVPECTNIKKYLKTGFTNEELQEEILTHYNLNTLHNPFEIEKKLVLSIVNKINSPIFIINHEKISFANQAFLNFFKLDNIRDLRKDYSNIEDLFLCENESKEFSLMHWLKKLLTAEEDQEITMQNKAQERLHLRLHGELLEHSDEYLIISQDINSEIEHAKELEELYNVDHLTKLPNRLKLISDLDEHEELALAILDIDDFKLINDFYGHVIGDYVLTEVANRISHYISHDNLVLYRLPSDSFAVLNKTHIEKEYFEIIIISLIQIVSKTAFVYKQEDEEIEIQVNLSSGLVFEKEKALAHADIALREAKKTHKDYVIYTNDLQQEVHNKNNLEWIHKIKIALVNDKIVPYFQPIVNNATQEIEKYECLVRLIDEKNEVISPYFFLEVAKHAKLYEPITKIMIKKSFQTFSNSKYEFSINLSIEDITDYNLFGYIKNMLSIYPLSNRVCFEILETEKIENYQVISDFVNEVRALGCKVSIDDFGSGYSNFSHLLNLNFDYLKIDASLIKDIHNDKNKQIIVKTIVTFAQELGIKTIGEYVESKEIYDYITKLGITYSQGYYFSPPVKTII
ncbi:MAG: GGDEF-domain containing protein [Arcobacter sp.]|nr:MAG: GGDEF-domain containing protein [Arcobacter sp.]